MRKFITVTVALLLAVAMLSSSAMAQGAKGSKGNMGTGKGQKQTDTVQGRPDHASNGNNRQKQTEAPDINPPADENSVTYDDSSNEEKTPGGPWKDKESKHEEKLPDGMGHGNAYGRRRNTQDVLMAIGQLTGEETAVQLNTLLTAYRDATDAETARAALTALLDALSQAYVSPVPDDNGDETEAQEPLSLTDIEKLREKVLANAGYDNGTLLALMRAYENAFRYMNHLEPIDEEDEGTEEDDQTGDGTETDDQTGDGTEEETDPAA